MKMKRYRLLKGLKMLLFGVVALLVFGLVTRELWNWLMPSIFGLRAITFLQALGLVLLSKILFGGFHRHGGGRRGWKREERWASMSEEERERFRAGMRGRRWCRSGPAGAPDAERGSI
jgi:hypothetical protein